MRQLASLRHSSPVSSASTAVSSPSSSEKVFWLRSRLRSCSREWGGRGNDWAELSVSVWSPSPFRERVLAHVQAAQLRKGARQTRGDD